MPEYKRVKDKQTGHEFSMPVGTFDEGDVDILDKPATNAGGEPLPAKPKLNLTPASPFASLTVAELKDEIDARNEGRDPEGDTYITPESPGNKPELIAALVADNPAGQ